MSTVSKHFAHTSYEAYSSRETFQGACGRGHFRSGRSCVEGTTQLEIVLLETSLTSIVFLLLIVGIRLMSRSYHTTPNPTKLIVKKQNRKSMKIQLQTCWTIR